MLFSQQWERITSNFYFHVGFESITQTSNILFNSFSSCLPESLRWLYVNNHVKESRQLIDKMAQINGKPRPNIYLTPPKPLKEKANPLLLFSSSAMSLKSLNIGFAW